ncbi:rhodanese-like domain-containing protein [Desulfoferula mesophila]|uniref:Sulfurtransferase n=1 Tax=Desulfoferula mesophila TaxID=3058419 RepID=A0AAU9EH94_9BACT|nr:sulfurtransferase [Desulfoferula mesophilus]
MKKFSLITVLTLTAVLALGSLAYAGLFGDKELEKEKLVVTFYEEVKRGDYEVVDTATLKGWVDAKKPMVIVDTMPFESSYKKNHLPGAVQFLFPIPDVTEMKPEDQAKYKKLLGDNKDMVIVVYCGFPKCTRSHNGAMWAKKLGYKNVYRYPGGIKAWMESDYPVASSE